MRSASSKLQARSRIDDCGLYARPGEEAAVVALDPHRLAGVGLAAGDAALEHPGMAAQQRALLAGTQADLLHRPILAAALCALTARMPDTYKGRPPAESRCMRRPPFAFSALAALGLPCSAWLVRGLVRARPQRARAGARRLRQPRAAGRQRRSRGAAAVHPRPAAVVRVQRRRGGARLQGGPGAGSELRDVRLGRGQGGTGPTSTTRIAAISPMRVAIWPGRPRASPPSAPRERALIEALTERYGPEARRPPRRRAAGRCRSARRAARRRRIRSTSSTRRGCALLADAYPDDPDILVLYAEAVMIATRGDWWDRKTGQPAGEIGIVTDRLERAVAMRPGHTGLNHYLIHAVDSSPHPERATAAADRLGGARAGVAAPGAHAGAHLRAPRPLSPTRCASTRRRSPRRRGRRRRSMPRGSRQASTGTVTTATSSGSRR